MKYTKYSRNFSPCHRQFWLANLNTSVIGTASKFSCNKPNDFCENLPCLSEKSLDRPAVSAVNTGSQSQGNPAPRRRSAGGAQEHGRSGAPRPKGETKFRRKTVQRQKGPPSANRRRQALFLSRDKLVKSAGGRQRKRRPPAAYGSNFAGRILRPSGEAVEHVGNPFFGTPQQKAVQVFIGK